MTENRNIGGGPFSILHFLNTYEGRELRVKYWKLEAVYYIKKKKWDSTVDGFEEKTLESFVLLFTER